MRQQTKKDEKYRYSCYSHDVSKDDKENFYCRSANAVLCGDYIFCQSCPLYGGISFDYRGESIPQCWYYDMDIPTGEVLTPEEQMQRIQGYILAGLTEEFPEYLGSDERGQQFAVIEKAIRYAAKAHKGAVRKGSKMPYIVHPMETMMLVARMTRDNDVIAAAALHDVVEDTPITIEEIREEFGEKIASLVDLESEDKQVQRPKAESWKSRKMQALTREKDAPMEAKMIMLADKLSNMRSSLRDYRKEGKAIWQKFNMKDEAEQQWYYRGVAEVLQEFKGTECYQEYLEILDEVFE